MNGCGEVEKRLSRENKCRKQEVFPVSSGCLTFKDKSDQRQPAEYREWCMTPLDLGKLAECRN